MRTAGHLFAGINGYGLGLHGFARTDWTVEYAPFPHRILELREPTADHLIDVLEVTNPPKVDVLTGGFPCQDLSLAGRGAGIHGRRSGLWGQYARIIGEVEPELVLIENVPALLHRGFEVVTRDLRSLGYNLEWDCLPAAALGAPHLRDRVWIAAHRHPEPVIFGAPAALFATSPEDGADTVGGDDDPDQPAGDWHRWPRAGWIDGDPLTVMPLTPLAPVGAARAGGRILWPTPQHADGSGGRREDAAVNRSTRDSIRTLERPSGAKAALSLQTAVDHDLLPTPVADDVRGDVVGHLRNKNGWDGAQRDRITSLAVLARNDFKPATPEQIAEARRTAAETERAERSGWTDRHATDEASLELMPTPQAADGERASEQGIRYYQHGTDNPTLLGAARRLDGTANPDLIPTPNARDGDATEPRPGLWPTPRTGTSESGGGETGTYRRTPSAANGTHGAHLQAEAVEADLAAGHIAEPDVDAMRRTGGALNPEWVEWLMGFPLGWTDPDRPTTSLQPWAWHQGEPPGIPRTTTHSQHRRDRLKALGNALVPSIPAWITARYTAALDRQKTTA